MGFIMNGVFKEIKELRQRALWRETEKGFTLIELTIVLLIGGILLSFLGSSLMVYMKKNKIKTTEFRMKAIRDSLNQYVSINGHYPCTASRFLGPNDNNFGQPVHMSAPTGCMNGFAAGTVRSALPPLPSGTGNYTIRIGAVPTRLLNLPDEFMTDDWGRKFTYAVTEELATEFEYQEDCGAISVEDVNGFDITNADNMGHYVLISHGETGAGGFPLGASITPIIPCPNAATADGENCNDDHTFVSTALISENPGAGFYDDYIYFQGQTKPVTQTIPGGTIAMFDGVYNEGGAALYGSTCPTGWTPYDAADGKFIVGSNPGLTQSMALYKVTPSDPPQTATFDFTVGDVSGGDPQANMPPYIALNYCQKNEQVQATCRSYGTWASIPATVCPAPPACPTVTPPPPPPAGKVLCGHYFNRGLLEANIYVGDLVFASTKVDAATTRGYHLWAVPLTRYLNNNPGGAVEKFVQPFVTGWATEMAYRTGYSNKGSWIGKVEITLAYPVVRALGMLSKDTSWAQLKSEQEIELKYPLGILEHEAHSINCNTEKNKVEIKEHVCP